MGQKKSFFKLFGGRKQGNIPVLLGNWEIENNFPDGFVIKNTKQKEEWHFDCSSNGWITGRNKTSESNPMIISVNTKGFTGYAPVLMDKESISKRRKEIEDSRKVKG